MPNVTIAEIGTETNSTVDGTDYSFSTFTPTLGKTYFVSVHGVNAATMASITCSLSMTNNTVTWNNYCTSSQIGPISSTYGKMYGFWGTPTSVGNGVITATFSSAIDGCFIWVLEVTDCDGNNPVAQYVTGSATASSHSLTRAEPRASSGHFIALGTAGETAVVSSAPNQAGTTYTNAGGQTISTPSASKALYHEDGGQGDSGTSVTWNLLFSRTAVWNYTEIREKRNISFFWGNNF